MLSTILYSLFTTGMQNLHNSPSSLTRSARTCPGLPFFDPAQGQFLPVEVAPELAPGQPDPGHPAIALAHLCLASALPHAITVPSHLDALGELSQWLEQLAPGLELSARGLFRLQLMMEEAVTNIIQNAYGEDGSSVDSPDRGNPGTRLIQVFLGQCDREFTLTICDDGLCFDPLQHRRSALPKTLALAPPGGAGIQLIRHFSDICVYQRCHDLNVLKLVINDPM